MKRLAAVVIVGGLVLGGCGTRASEQEIRAGVSGGPVELDEAALDQLRQTGASAPGTGTPVSVGTPTNSGTAALPGTVTQPGGAGPLAAGAANRPGGQPLAAPPASSRASPAACTTPGSPLHLGQIGSFSGVFGPLTGSARTAMAIWAKRLNERGGLACHPVVLHAVDDGGDPSRGSALVGELVSKYQIQAFVGMFSLALPGMVGAIENAKLPVVGGDMVSDPWFAHPQFFPQGGGLRAIVDGALKQAVDDGRTVHGLVYCVEVGVCGAVAKMLPERARVVGAKVVYSSPVSLTQTDFTAQCQNAKNAGVQAFGMAVDGSAIARVARSCAAINYFPQFVTGGGVVSSAQAKDPGIRRNTMSTASSIAPWFLTDTPGQREYAEALERYAPGMETDGPSIIAWAAGKLFEAVVERMGDRARSAPIATASILTALGKIKGETLDGLSPPITFGPGQKAAPDIPCVYFELDTEKGWVAPHGSKYICTGGKT